MNDNEQREELCQKIGGAFLGAMQRCAQQGEAFEVQQEYRTQGIEVEAAFTLVLELRWRRMEGPVAANSGADWIRQMGIQIDETPAFTEEKPLIHVTPTGEVQPCVEAEEVTGALNVKALALDQALYEEWDANLGTMPPQMAELQKGCEASWVLIRDIAVKFAATMVEKQTMWARADERNQCAQQAQSLILAKYREPASPGVVGMPVSVHNLAMLVRDGIRENKSE